MIKTILGTALFILVGGLAFTYGMPLAFKDVMEQICSNPDDYYKLDEEDILEVLTAIEDNLGVLSRELEHLRKHYIETRIHEEEICTEPHRNDESTLSKDIFNTTENTSTDVYEKLKSFYSGLVESYVLINGMIEEEHDSDFEDLYKDLLYHPEGGVIGIICFVGPYVAPQERKLTTSLSLPTPHNRADRICRDFNVIDSIYNSTLKWIANSL